MSKAHHLRPMLFFAFLFWSGTTAAQSPSYLFLNGQTLELEGETRTTGQWTEGERQQVARYFDRLAVAAPALVRLIDQGKALGPVYVLRVEQAKRSMGLVSYPPDRDKTYLVLSTLFFQAYDQTADSVGYDGGNFTLWFFIHEMVHLAEIRSLPDNHSPLPTLDRTSQIFRVLSSKIDQAMTTLLREGISPTQYILGADLTSQVDIVRDVGLPTKYSLLNVREALAEIVAALVLSPAYQPPTDISEAVSPFFSR